MPPRNAVVVSLHDVSPLTQEACRRILAELENLNATPVSLLAIPDHHGRGNFADDPAFCAWLTSRVARGDEVVLHGYHHREQGRSAGSLILPHDFSDLYFGTEAEFSRLSFEKARARAVRGLESFRRIGITPPGFIAPAWILCPDAERAIRELGFRYTTRVSGVLDFKQERFHPSRSLCWSVRSAWRRIASLAWNALLFRRLSSAPLMRIAIHPVDVEHPRIWAQILRLTSLAVEQRTRHTYESWLASLRTASPRAGDTSRPAAG